MRLPLLPSRRLAWAAFLLFVLLTTGTRPLRAQSWSRALAIGPSAANGSAGARHSATDAAGNTYVTGHFDGTVAFGGTTLNTTNRFGSWFLAKINAAGQWQWALPLAADGSALGLDAAGNVYLTGTFDTRTATFGATTLTSTGTSASPATAYVAKLTPAGQWLWAAQTTGAGNTLGNSLAVDAAGNCFLTGSYQGATVSFGATALSGSGNDQEAYVAKLDAGGQWLWAQRTTGSGFDAGTALAADGAGGAYVAGTFGGASLTLGTTTLTDPTQGNMFVARLGATGQWLWA